MTPFDVYADHDERRLFEWIDGAVEMLPDLSRTEIALRDTLLDVVGGYIESNGLGLLIPAPFPVRMPEEMRRAREPDVIFVPNAFVETMQQNYVNSHGVALVIEICDHRTRHIDFGVKLHEYQFAGIPEYWIIDAERRTLTVFFLQHDGYQRVDPDPHGLIRSRAVQGFEIYAVTLFAPGER
jgi:Uma2 family endonuclease